RYGPRRGLENPTFLDPQAFEAAFVEPLAPYLDRVATVIFEFGTFSREAYPEPQAFFDELGVFLARLPSGLQYSVEIINREFLCAGCLAMLRWQDVAPVFNSRTRMPSPGDPLEIDEAWTPPHAAARALLRPGRAYDQSVATLSPYREIREPYP